MKGVSGRKEYMHRNSTTQPANMRKGKCLFRAIGHIQIDMNGHAKETALIT